MYYLGEEPFHGNLLSAVYDMVSTNEQAGPPERGTEGSAIDRLLRVFGDVRAGEGRDIVFMFLNIFLLLVAYYVLKTVREPLILTAGGAELKAYAAAAQAAVLLFYVAASAGGSAGPRQRLSWWSCCFSSGGSNVFPAVRQTAFHRLCILRVGRDLQPDDDCPVLVDGERHLQQA